MKKLFLLIIILIVVRIVTYAQSNFSFEFTSGYNFGISPTQINGLYNYSYIDSAKSKMSVGNVYLGNGLNLGLKINYQLKNNSQLSLEIEDLFGEKNYVTQTFKDSTHQFVFYSSMYKIKPSFSFFRLINNVKLSATVGVIVGFGKVTREYTREIPGLVYLEKYDYYGGMALGLFSGFGVEYIFTPRLSFIGKIGANGLTYLPARGKITEAYKNTGTPENILGNMSVSTRETIYEDQVTMTENNSYDEPSKELRPYFNMNAFYFKLGIVWYPEGKTQSEEKPARKL